MSKIETHDDKQYIETTCPCGRLHMADVTKLATERDRFEKAYHEQSHEVEQILGKALGYPWYKDDQKNFPGATEADGVCVGEHVPEPFAAEAATRLTKLSAQLKIAAEALEYYANHSMPDYRTCGPAWTALELIKGIDNENPQCTTTLGEPNS